MTFERAVTLLQTGIPIAFPTETVYGLGASAFDEEAIEAIYALKRRPKDNPLIVHVATIDQLEMVADTFPKAILEHFWPGPLTVIVPKKASVPPIVSAGLPTIGVRMPAHPLARALIEATGPLVAPSANLSGRPSCTTAAHVREDFGEELFVLDGGACVQGLESTVLALDPPTILRPGMITKERLETFLGEDVRMAGESSRPQSPGMKYRHYAPRGKVILVDEKVPGALENLTPETLYAQFRKADQRGVAEIYVYCDAKMRANAALMNRLIKAAQ